LSNSGEAVTLRSTIIDGTVTVFEMEDQVRYNDNEPWPTDADDDLLGRSLNRVDLTAYGNLPESWASGDPSPGRYGEATNPTPWHNAAFPEDVINDGSVVPLDALTVINALNERGSGPLPTRTPTDPYLDVTGDNMLSPLDALEVINWLNDAAASAATLAAVPSTATKDGEAESPAAPLAARARLLAAAAASSEFDTLTDLTETTARRRAGLRTSG
jgi:hypothetical protein